MHNHLKHFKNKLLTLIHFLRLLYGGFYYIIYKYPYIGDIWDRNLCIFKSDLVLEIGSGWNPSLRSDVLIEKYIFDKTERRYIAYVPKHRPFIVGDGCYLPFVDNAFDYLICNHVIEHLNNPSLMFEEFKRITKKGFISAPYGVWESISPGKYHKWFVFIRNGRLVLEKKIEMKDRKYRNEVESERKAEREIKYEYGIEKPLNWEIIKKNSVENFVFAELDQNYENLYVSKKAYYPMSVQLKMFFNETLRRIFFSTSTKFNIFALLACPVCKNKLSKMDNFLICNKCEVKYDIINNIPILLKEKATKLPIL